MNTATATTATAPIVTGISALLRRHRHTPEKRRISRC